MRLREMAQGRDLGRPLEGRKGNEVLDSWCKAYINPPGREQRLQRNYEREDPPANGCRVAATGWSTGRCWCGRRPRCWSPGSVPARTTRSTRPPLSASSRPRRSSVCASRPPSPRPCPDRPRVSCPDQPPPPGHLPPREQRIGRATPPASDRALGEWIVRGHSAHSSRLVEQAGSACGTEPFSGGQPHRGDLHRRRHRGL